MTFSRLLPLLLLVPALTMADEDRNFKLTSENFKVGSLLDGSLLENASKKAITLDRAIAISQEPVFPLQPNTLYLRYKKSAKEYFWFSGEAKPEEYKKLHAFNLKENHLSAREVIGLRLYASRQYKAFQDESDIYFDAEYVYSPRVPKLLFMKNGQWQILKESTHPGMVQIKSDEKDLDIVALNSSLKAGSKAVYPVNDGVYVFAFGAPDKLPYVDAGVLKPGEVLTFDVSFPVSDSGDIAPVNMSVSLEQVHALQTVEEAENLYDVFSSEVDRNFTRIDTTEFSKFYPPVKSADSLGMDDSNKVYRSYVSHYNFKRSEAQTLWRNKKLGTVSELYKAFHAKFDSLQALPAQINMTPDFVKKIMSATDSTKIDSLEFRFGIDRNRVETTWKGVVDEIPMDSLLKLMMVGDGSFVTTLFLANNKPVWVFKEGKIVGRYHYRYDKLGFRMGDKLIFGKGEFTLPLHIAVEPEVVEWLKNRAPESSSSSIASSSSSEVVKDTVVAEPNKKIIEHATRGTVALIDSGSFRFRGKVVSMSPYAIHTTEVTQEFFHKIMGLLPSVFRIGLRSRAQISRFRELPGKTLSMLARFLAVICRLRPSGNLQAVLAAMTESFGRMMML